MDNLRPHHAASSNDFQSKSSTQHLRQCQTCCHTGQACHPGLTVLNKLRFSIGLLPHTEGFEISGSTEIETCQRPCHLVWRISATESWLFGDVEPEADIDNLIHRSMARTAADDRPAGPEPAAMLFATIGALQ